MGVCELLVCVLAYEVPLEFANERVLEELEDGVDCHARLVVDDGFVEQRELDTVLQHKVLDPRVIVGFLATELIARIGQYSETPAVVPVVQIAVEGIRSRGQTSEAGHISNQRNIALVRGQRHLVQVDVDRGHVEQEASGRCPLIVGVLVQHGILAVLRRVGGRRV